MIQSSSGFVLNLGEGVLVRVYSGEIVKGAWPQGNPVHSHKQTSSRPLPAPVLVNWVGPGKWRKQDTPIWEVLPRFQAVESGQCQRAPAGPALTEWANAMWHVTRGI